MQSGKPNNMIDEIKNILYEDIEGIENKNLLKIDYRERVRIERGLFLLLKVLCERKFGFRIHGFSKNERERLYEFISMKDPEQLFINVADQRYQLKIFIQKLSIENAYVCGDALSSVGATRKSALRFIAAQVRSIIKKVDSLDLDAL